VLLVYLHLLQERDVPDMSAVACVTSVDDTPAVATPRLLLAYLQLLRLWDASDTSADACVTSVDDTTVLLALASAAPVVCL